MNKTIRRISHLFCIALVIGFSQSVIADNYGGLEIGVLKCSVVPVYLVPELRYNGFGEANANP